MGPIPTVPTTSLIASAVDCNGDDVLNTPESGTCDFPWVSTVVRHREFSAGISAAGTIFATYQTIDEASDTTLYSQSHKRLHDDLQRWR